MVDAVDRRAQALAEITTMQNELVEANSKIDQLQRMLDQANDRLAMVAEERKTYRDDSLLFRAKLIELATSMANIGLLTSKAPEIMMTIGPLVTAQAHQEDSEKAAAIINSLPVGIGQSAADAIEKALHG